MHRGLQAQFSNCRLRYSPASSIRRSPSCSRQPATLKRLQASSAFCRVMRRADSSISRLRCFDSITSTPKTSLQCASRPRCVPSWPSCACGRGAVLRLSVRQVRAFPRSRGLPFWLWRRCASGCWTWSGSTMTRSARRKYRPGEASGASGERQSPSGELAREQLFGCRRRQLSSHPAPEIGQRARGQRFFARQGLCGCSAEFAAPIECRRLLQWGKQAEIHIHRLKRGRAGIDGVDMAAGNVRKQGAVRGRCRRRGDALPVALRGGKTARQQADGGRFHVSLAARDLASEAPAAVSSEPQCLIEQLGGIQKCIAVKSAQARKFRLLQAGNGAEDPYLLAVFKLGLEAHHVEQRAEPVVLPVLDN